MGPKRMAIPSLSDVLLILKFYKLKEKKEKKIYFQLAFDYKY